jgi:hypothetical protein
MGLLMKKSINMGLLMDFSLRATPRENGPLYGVFGKANFCEKNRRETVGASFESP